MSAAAMERQAGATREGDDVTPDDDGIVVLDNPRAGRYELFASEQLAGWATYTLSGDTLTIPHTEVRPGFDGRGLGARLAKFALDDIRRRGLRVVPRCPFIAAYIRRHPEYADLVAG
jgi:predicted GNAT family acetyltransferase